MPADAELEKVCLQQLSAAAKDFMAAGGSNVSLAALALAGLTAAAAASPASSEAAQAEAAGAEAAGSSGQQGGSLHSLGRSGFMQRAFARQQPSASGGASAGAHAFAEGGGIGAAAATEAFAVLQQRVREFNACVAYAGLQPGG